MPDSTCAVPASGCMILIRQPFVLICSLYAAAADWNVPCTFLAQPRHRSLGRLKEHHCRLVGEIQTLRGVQVLR